MIHVQRKNDVKFKSILIRSSQENESVLSTTVTLNPAELKTTFINIVIEGDAAVGLEITVTSAEYDTLPQIVVVAPPSPMSLLSLIGGRFEPHKYKYDRQQRTSLTWSDDAHAFKATDFIFLSAE